MMYLYFLIFLSVSGLGFLMKKYLNKRPFVPQYNGDTVNWGDVSSYNGIGCRHLGEFRNHGRSYVCYTFFCLYFPIVPLACIRMSDEDFESFGGAYQKTTIKHKIYGSEKWNVFEVFSIYMIHWGAILSFFQLIYIVGYYIDRMH